MSKTKLLIYFCFLLEAAGCSSSTEKSWAGKTYLLGITKDRWADPPRIGNEIGDFVPNFLMRIERGGEGEIDVTLGTADATPAQQVCNPTTQIASTESGYPSVVIAAPTFPLYIQHPLKPELRVNATIYDLTITNVLPDGGTPASEGELSAVMDLRELYPLFTQLGEPTPDIVCGALKSFGAPCETCAFDSEAYCLSIRAIGLGANETPDMTVEPIEPSAVDPSCLAP